MCICIAGNESVYIYICMYNIYIHMYLFLYLFIYTHTCGLFICFSVDMGIWALPLGSFDFEVPF